MAKIYLKVYSMGMSQTLLENIEAVPTLPGSVQAVEAVYQDVDSTLQDMVDAVEKDPLLVAEILREVNSPLYGLSRTITVVGQAISLFGKEAIRTFVLNSVINSSFRVDLSPYNMSQDEFATACKKQAYLALQWLRKKQNILSIVAPAALLVDLGRVVIAKTLIEDAKTDVIAKALEAGENIADAEKLACGAQTTDVTATIFHKWNFNSDMVHVIRYSDDPEGTVGEDKEMAAYLKAIRETVLPNGNITEESIATAKETIEEFELDLDRYEMALEKVLAS